MSFFFHLRAKLIYPRAKARRVWGWRAFASRGGASIKQHTFVGFSLVYLFGYMKNVLIKFSGGINVYYKYIQTI